MSGGAESPAPGGAQADLAREAVSRAEAAGVRVVMLTFVDNAGITRARAIPLRLFERAAQWGVGLSSAWYTVTATDAVTSSPYVGNPTGDIRLVPDPGALRLLAAQPGWAWAPTDQYNQDGARHPCCSRSYLRNMTSRAAETDLTLKVSFELEWFMAQTAHDQAAPVHDGPAVGALPLIRMSEYVGELIDALERQDVGVEAINGEYSDGQLELSFAPRDPVAAADANVLTRLTIHALAARHGYRASFSPAFAGPMGNGGHVHLSVWRQGANLFAGGDGPHGMTATGAAFLAGLLAELPAMTAIGAPCAASYLRLLPSRWAGVYSCWGRENREAALRFITGMAGTEGNAANAEVKCFDEAANPYLRVARIESFIDDLIRQDLADLDAFADALRQQLDEAAADPRTIALKSVIAYRTGLDITEPAKSEAASAFQRWRAAGWADSRADSKPVRDYLLHLAMPIIERHNIALHIHCGDGDPDVVFEHSRPQDLYGFLRRYDRRPIVLMHAGHPWSEEAAYIAAILPHVYIDLSVLIPWASLDIESYLARLIGMMPSSKLLYSSDQVYEPELFWLPARFARRALERALSAAIDADYLTTGQAQSIGRGILAGNTRRVHAL